jgi:hypothetical protein
MDEDYPPDTTVEMVIDLQGKQAKPYRPVIVGMNDGIKSNKVAIEAMRLSRCSFVIFDTAWMHMSWEKMRVVLLRAWPEVLKAVNSAARWELAMPI